MALAAVGLLAVLTSCSSSNAPASEPSPGLTAAAAPRGCTDVAALTTSLDKLKSLNVQQDGVDRLQGALVQIQTESDVAVTSAAGALRPSVTKVRTAVDAVQRVVRGVSENNLRQNLSTISAALVQVRTAGDELATRTPRICPES